MKAQRQFGSEDSLNIQQVHYLNFARKQKHLTPEQEKKLLARSRSGRRQATEALVNANQALVVAVSETYQDDRLGFLDRAAEGNVALISACRDYQPGLDGSFRRYCVMRIRKAIENAIAECAGFRILRLENGWYYPALSSDRVNSISGAMCR